MDILFDKTMNLLSGMLDYRSTRHKIIISNIANMDTEGFKPSDISFKQVLGKTNAIQMTTTDPGHIGRKEGGAAPVEVTTSEEKVKIDTEMANLAENQLMYNMTVDMLSRKFKAIKTVLTEAK
ncbi:MAG: flagellar basal-body rod protein FlgB [Syntrophaceae bacterium CG2_30_58_14]|nr:MAG: flagellar basal-body rod protein FlgB [Syntrophaceae bacterium CG2_30_58_14]